MKFTPFEPSPILNKRDSGFSLIEVVLAIGIFLITVLALVGLLGPTLQSVDEVEKTDEVSSVVNTVNAFLQSSPDIAPNASKFDTIYNAVTSASDSFATIYVFRAFTDPNDASAIGLKVGFHSSDAAGTDATILDSDIDDAAGPIFRVVLTASSVTPTAHVADNGVGKYPRYELNKLLTGTDAYPEGYFAMEVRIFAEDPGPSFTYDTNLTKLAGIEPIFTYNTAVVR